MIKISNSKWSVGGGCTGRLGDVDVAALARRPSSQLEVRSSFPDTYWSPCRGRKWSSGAADLHSAINTTFKRQKKFLDVDNDTRILTTFGTANWYRFKKKYGIWNTLLYYFIKGQKGYVTVFSRKTITYWTWYNDNIRVDTIWMPISSSQDTWLKVV